tara:strand:- start:630 stop:1007 length:378 start_codon:yes stop_codon:yes gene_type:complete
MWSNVGFAQKFIYVCESKSPKGYEGFQRIYSIDTNRKEIKHISSYDTNTKKAYNVDKFENIIYWSKDLAISYDINIGDNSANYETYSFIKNKLIVSAHFPKGDMVASDDPIDKYFFNQLYDCSKD